VHTLSIETPTVIILDGLRKQRSLSSYEGDMVTDTALEECLRQAIALMARLEGALSMQRPV